MMGKAGWWRVRIDAVPIILVPFTDAEVRDLLTVAALGETARAFGAAQRAFEQAVAYAGERRQFGQPIGRFQAIQHKLANCHIALRAVQLTIANAAAQYDLEARLWRWFAAAALGTAAGSLRQVSLETQHAFGAIGYSEEHEAPRHFRQVHVGMLRHGGQRPPVEQLASHFLDHGSGAFPEYDLGASGNAFRNEVRAWLDGYWSGERRARHEQLSFREREYDREFARALGQTGWIGLNWPKRFGGQERGAFEQLAFMEEMEHAEAPRAGAPVQAAMLQVYGTPEQQQPLPAGNLARGSHLRHGLQRTAGRLRPSVAEDARGPRRRPLCDQWAEDLDHDLLGRVHAARDPYRSERDTASCGHHHVHRSDDDARHHDPSVRDDVWRHLRQHLL